MDLFATKVQLSSSVTSAEVYSVIKQWLENSPHYKIKKINYNLGEEEFFQNTSDSTSVHILAIEANGDNIFALRFINKEQNNTWRTDCVFSEMNNSLSIRLSCETNAYSTRLPRLHKPHLIKLLFDNKMTSLDGALPVVDYPIEITDSPDDLNLCAKIMSGSPSVNMPIVYLSYNAFDDKHYLVNPKRLAIRLSGMAHVLVEPNKDFAIKLRELAKYNNAYHGYVGVYFPGTCYREIIGPNEHYMDGNLNEKAAAQNISLAVQRAALIHSNINDWSWDGVYLAYQKRKVLYQTDLAEKSSAELNAFLQLFDAENGQLREKVSELQSQLDMKNAQLENLKQKYSGGVIKLKFDLEEFYSDECNDLLVNILSCAKKHMLDGSRPADIIDRMLELNKPTGHGQRIMAELKKALLETSLSQRRKLLRSCGFTVIEGKHDKIIFHDDKYIFVLSNTPSDHRSVDNCFSDISKKIDVCKKFF